MLTTLQKARILIKAGIQIPAFPGSQSTVDGLPGVKAQPDLPLNESLSGALATPEREAWNQAAEALHVEFVAARTARSLRQSHESDLILRLRTVNAREPAQRPARRPGLR